MPSFAESPADLPDPAVIRAMSGLEYVRAMLDGRVPLAAIDRLMGYQLESVEPGRVTLRGTPDFAHSNAFGAVQGGWYATVLDSAMGCAVMTGVPQGRHWTTLEFKVNILRAVPLGTEILATGMSDHAGRSTAAARAEMRDAGTGRLHATASTTCLILD